MQNPSNDITDSAIIRTQNSHSDYVVSHQSTSPTAQSDERCGFQQLHIQTSLVDIRESHQIWGTICKSTISQYLCNRSYPEVPPASPRYQGYVRASARDRLLQGITANLNSTRNLSILKRIQTTNQSCFLQSIHKLGVSIEECSINQTASSKSLFNQDNFYNQEIMDNMIHHFLTATFHVWLQQQSSLGNSYQSAWNLITCGFAMQTILK